MLTLIKTYLYSTVVVLLAVIIFAGCKEEKTIVEAQIPEIIGLSSNKVLVTDELTIFGQNFGLASKNSRLILEKDGYNPQKDTLITLDSDLCIKWTYAEIQIKIPNDFVSGYLGVLANDILSNKVHIIIDKLPNLETVEIPSGSFIMGSESGWDNEQPEHKVIISNNLYYSKFEVSQYLWSKIMTNNPSKFKDNNLPINNITWFDAIKFCNAISNKFDYDTCYTFLNDSMVLWDRKANGFRLPTEAEWEYACRAESNSDFPFASGPDEVAWYSENSAFTPHPSGQKKANGFGLYDMQGNVWEWCWDWYDNTFYHYSLSKCPIGPGIGIKRVLRGGASNSGKAYIRASNRTFTDTNFNFCGIRLVRFKF